MCRGKRFSSSFVYSGSGATEVQTLVLYTQGMLCLSYMANEANTSLNSRAATIDMNPGRASF